MILFLPWLLLLFRAPPMSSYSASPSRASLPAWGLLLLCRAGFEQAAAEELEARLARLGLRASLRAEPASAFVAATFAEGVLLDELADACAWQDAIFARQTLPWFARLASLPERDRATPLAQAVEAAGGVFRALHLEHPDADATRPLSGFCRRFAAPLAQALDKRKCLQPRASRRDALHVVFTAQDEAWLCSANEALTPAFPMGIARLRMPREAPSRSTLKLVEAFAVLLNDHERRQELRAGQRVVDLGAAPGGWSYHLAQLGLRVTAIDNGPLAPSVHATGMVDHVRADGFTWRPRHTVDWVVCDMVEQPARVTALMADWIVGGRARHALFNLKLPMKKRYAAVQQCADLLRRRCAGAPHELRIRQLYHDREEVTVYFSLHAPVRAGRG